MFPIETISAKMLDYYVGRSDTMIIDAVSYTHLIVYILTRRFIDKKDTKGNDK